MNGNHALYIGLTSQHYGRGSKGGLNEWKYMASTLFYKLRKIGL